MQRLSVQHLQSKAREGVAWSLTTVNRRQAATPDKERCDGLHERVQCGGDRRQVIVAGIEESDDHASLIPSIRQHGQRQDAFLIEVRQEVPGPIANLARLPPGEHLVRCRDHRWQVDDEAPERLLRGLEPCLGMLQVTHSSGVRCLQCCSLFEHMADILGVCDGPGEAGVVADEHVEGLLEILVS
jgi:hypothetical protein